MSDDDITRTRRTMLKTVGATGLALGVAGTAAADTDEDVQSDGATTEGYWESRCLSYFQCSTGSSCQRQTRYCSNGSCSGWENDGCCATQYC